MGRNTTNCWMLTRLSHAKQPPRSCHHWTQQHCMICNIRQLRQVHGSNEIPHSPPWSMRWRMQDNKCIIGQAQKMEIRAHASRTDLSDMFSVLGCRSAVWKRCDFLGSNQRCCFGANPFSRTFSWPGLHTKEENAKASCTRFSARGFRDSAAPRQDAYSPSYGNAYCCYVSRKRTCSCAGEMFAAVQQLTGAA